MRLFAVPLSILSLMLAGCATHEPPRCTGKLEPINTPIHSQAAPDGNGR